MQKDKLQLFFIFIAILVVMLISANNLSGYGIISLALFFFILLKFIYDLGTHISVKNIIILLMVMQWLLGPVLGYIYLVDTAQSYQMKVAQPVYFGYVLPATLAFIFGLYVKLRRTRYKPNFSVNVDYYQKGTILILLGFLFEILPGIGFLGYLLAGLKYIGVFYMVLSPNKKRYYWITFVLTYLFVIHSLGSGMFHEMLLWTCFLLMLVFYFNRKSFLFRFSIIFSGFFFVVILQLVKPEFRAQIETTSENKFSLFINLFSSKLFSDAPLLNDKVIADNVVRLNQGWIISNVIDYIPAQQPFANGKTISDAIIASVFPRFLFPDKPMAGGRSNMENYAGITLNETTSMDISQVGEAYANFGVTGGIVMMFILGLFFNGVITFIEKKCLKHPELLLWIPLVFFQVIKAETSLVTVLNHLVKASLITWFFFSSYGQMILDYKFGKWKFGIRTFSLSNTGQGYKGVRRRKGLNEKKRYRVFEDRVKGKKI